MQFPPSELIINEDGSIYHLKLKPGEVAPIIITVGDPERVDMVAENFDTIELKKRSREFYTTTGVTKGKRISVISTGIGTDNIDIVINELDALFNIDFTSRTEKTEKTKLTFVRIGTSGCIQPHIPVDSFCFSKFSIGLDGLMGFYDTSSFLENQLVEKVDKIFGDTPLSNKAFACKCPFPNYESIPNNMIHGITLTMSGFYAPQGRILRYKVSQQKYIKNFSEIVYSGLSITNLEMETSGIYGLSHILGHEALSFNALLANRITNEFSRTPQKTVTRLIKEVLHYIEHNL